MEKVLEQGKAKSIGVSNYRESDFKATLKTAKVKPSINQTEFHTYLQREGLLPYQKSQDIAMAAYGALTPITKGKPGPIDDILASVAKKYYVDEADVLLRWCMDQDVVVITTSSKEDRLATFLRATTFKLTPREVKDLSEAGLKKHVRSFWQKHFDPDSKI